MEDDIFAPRRPSTRTRKVAAKMGAALADINNRSQVILFLNLLFYHTLHLVVGNLNVRGKPTKWDYIEFASR